MKVNLTYETIGILRQHGKTIDDIRFIQGDDFVVSNSIQEVFEIMNVEYDDGYGSAEVAEDLKIVGDDWWLERHEYDGSEWWEYKELPKREAIEKSITTCIVNGCGWQSLAECNESEE